MKFYLIFLEKADILTQQCYDKVPLQSNKNPRFFLIIYLLSEEALGEGGERRLMFAKVPLPGGTLQTLSVEVALLDFALSSKASSSKPVH